MPDVAGAGTGRTTRCALGLWAVVVAFVAVGALRSYRIGIPFRDPHGAYFVGRLTLAAAIFAGLLVVDGAWRGRTCSPRGIWTTIRNRWTPVRIGWAWLALVAYQVTYLTYHNLKSWNAFNPLRDETLLRWDRSLAGGHDPAAVLHALLGQDVAAWVLMVWYETFPTVVVVAVPAAVVLARRMRDAYVAIAALVWVWILGTASYYLMPSLGPFDSAPEQFASLPHMMIQDTQARYLAQREHLLAHPEARDAFAQIGAFASLHVGVTAVILGIAWWHGLRHLTWILGVFLAGTMIATVYLGWHYAVDDLAGLAIAAISWWLAPRTVGVRGRPAARAVKQSATAFATQSG